MTKLHYEAYVFFFPCFWHHGSFFVNTDIGFCLLFLGVSGIIIVTYYDGKSGDGVTL